jgi:hypothetical protein
MAAMSTVSVEESELMHMDEDQLINAIRINNGEKEVVITKFGQQLECIAQSARRMQCHMNAESQAVNQRGDDFLDQLIGIKLFKSLKLEMRQSRKAVAQLAEQAPSKSSLGIEPSMRYFVLIYSSGL